MQERLVEAKQQGGSCLLHHLTFSQITTIIWLTPPPPKEIPVYFGSKLLHLNPKLDELNMNALSYKKQEAVSHEDTRDTNRKLL